MMKIEIKKIASHVGAFILGILTLIVHDSVTIHLNRAILKADIESVVISQSIDKDWSLTTRYRIHNTGNTTSTIKIDKLLINFPNNTLNPIALDISTYKTIEANSTLIDKFNTSFPPLFEDIPLESSPKMKNLELSIKNQNDQLICNISKDSSHHLYYFYFGKESKRLKELFLSINGVGASAQETIKIY